MTNYFKTPDHKVETKILVLGIGGREYNVRIRFTRVGFIAVNTDAKIYKTKPCTN